jgi:hypothetical protein
MWWRAPPPAGSYPAFEKPKPDGRAPFVVVMKLIAFKPFGVVFKTRFLQQNQLTCTMIGENRQLVTDEAVEFEEFSVEVHQDFRRIMDHFRGIYKILYPN